ncbi:MAG: InlB B-repeat-containing protein, partial [Candidatus Pelagibacterales bacterium]
MKNIYLILLSLTILSCSDELEMEEPSPTQYTLAVSAGPGGTVSEGGAYDEGTEVTITATADEGYEFIGWSGSDSAEASLTTTLNSNTTFEAIFEFIEVDFTNLNATGDLSEQSPERAKKTIYGKWNFGNSSETNKSIKKDNQPIKSIFNKRDYRKKSKSKGLSQKLTCSFNFIEFLDDSYIMAIESDGYSEYLSGDFIINENSEGKVSTVDLKYNLGSESITIATLSDIIVVETDSKLDATFEILLNIPADADFVSCNSLSGNFSVDKEEPMEASETAIEGSNHAMLIKTWEFNSIIDSDYPDDNSIALIKEEYCINYDSYDEATDTFSLIENCSPPTSVLLTFSTYGTYTFMFEGGSDGTT